MEAVEADLKQVVGDAAAVRACAMPGLATWGQPKLEECQRRWDRLSAQV